MQASFPYLNRSIYAHEELQKPKKHKNSLTCITEFMIMIKLPYKDIEITKTSLEVSEDTCKP